MVIQLPELPFDKVVAVHLVNREVAERTFVSYFTVNLDQFEILINLMKIFLTNIHV